MYFGALECAVLDVQWLMKALRVIALTPPVKSSGRILGLNNETGVWTEAELRAALHHPSCEEMSLLMRVLEWLGAAVKLPLMRFKTSDEQWIYTNVFCSGATCAELSMFSDAKRNAAAGGQLREVRRVYRGVSCDLFAVYIAMTSQLSRLGRLEYMGSRGLVRQVGAAELMVRPLENGWSLEISVYSREPQGQEAPSWMQRHSVMMYLWSILHLACDCVEAHLQQWRNFAYAVRSSSTSEVEEPVNFSVGAVHEFIDRSGRSGEVERRTVCSLCHRCSVADLDCPYNGILSSKPVVCLCGGGKSCCMSCGICGKCAAHFWNAHCATNPNCLTSTMDQQVKVPGNRTPYLRVLAPVTNVPAELKPQLDFFMFNESRNSLYLIEYVYQLFVVEI